MRPKPSSPALRDNQLFRLRGSRCVAATVSGVPPFVKRMWRLLQSCTTLSRIPDWADVSAASCATTHPLAVTTRIARAQPLPHTLENHEPILFLPAVAIATAPSICSVEAFPRMANVTFVTQTSTGEVMPDATFAPVPTRYPVTPRGPSFGWAVQFAGVLS